MMTRMTAIRATGRGRQGGFSLMELLIAVCVLAMITGIVYSGMISVTDTAAIARGRAERLRLKQFVARQFRSAISTVYIDSARQQPELAFAGYAEQGPFGPAASLQFCSAEPMGGSHGLPGMRKTISYSVGEGGDEAAEALLWGSDEPVEQMTLSIMETPLVLSEPGSGEEEGTRQSAEEFFGSFFDDGGSLSAERSVPVRSLNFMYYDGETQEWVEEWDSMLEGRMPWAVRVMVNFPRSEEELDSDYSLGINPEENPDLDMTVVLPMSAGTFEPFLDPNHQREPEMDTDLENMTGDIRRERNNEASKRSE